jgi:hypothetical protein
MEGRTNQASALSTALSIFDVMMRSDDETIVPKTHTFCMEEAIVTQSGLCMTQQPRLTSAPRSKPTTGDELNAQMRILCNSESYGKLQVI